MMQTFIPHSDFQSTAHALDTKRLGKQRVEVIQIIRALTRPGYGWAAHPAVLMWKGHEEALGRYGLTMCEVWVEKGFGDTCAATIRSDLRDAGVTTLRTYDQLAEGGVLPEWLFDPALLRSHQSALLRKDPDHYRPLFPDVPDDIGYVWPVRSPAVVERERRMQENARRRAARAAEKAAGMARVEAERLRRRRSAAARRGWQTRNAAKDEPGAAQPRAAQPGAG
jgi:hypothetical protein